MDGSLPVRPLRASARAARGAADRRDGSIHGAQPADPAALLRRRSALGRGHGATPPARAAACRGRAARTSRSQAAPGSSSSLAAAPRHRPPVRPRPHGSDRRSCVSHAAASQAGDQHPGPRSPPPRLRRRVATWWRRGVSEDEASAWAACADQASRLTQRPIIRGHGPAPPPEAACGQSRTTSDKRLRIRGLVSHAPAAATSSSGAKASAHARGHYLGADVPIRCNVVVAGGLNSPHIRRHP